MEKIAAVLIAAHVIADFVLQTDGIVYRKDRVSFLLLHAGSHAALSYVVLQVWTCWQVPVLVVFFHGLIDFTKQRFKKETPTIFIIDQIIHAFSLLFLAWLLVRFSWIPVFEGIGYKILVGSAGFVACIQGAGYLIARITKQLIDQNNLELNGLQNGGKMIGRLERCIIFLFIFINQPSGIGFLFAAKSILRFEEAKQQKLAEYILIGTLWSFSLAMALAFVAKWAINL
jgi:hypothetical protein